MSSNVSNLKTFKTVISGSYRKHLGVMREVKEFLEQRNIEVLAPVSFGVVNPGEEFIILDEDPTHDARLLQDSIFAKMRMSAFHIVANQDGYLGKAALIELGYAVALGLHVLTLEPVEDPNLVPYCRPFKEAFPEWRAQKTELKVLKGAHV